LDKARNNNSIGLGLAIVKELVEQLEGKINLKFSNNYLEIILKF
jgi:signal transduction histidine kinase